MASITAIYENGVFRPTTEVLLREGATVQIVLPENADASPSEVELGYPKGFFETYAGSLAHEQMERPEQPPYDSDSQV